MRRRMDAKETEQEEKEHLVHVRCHNRCCLLEKNEEEEDDEDDGGDEDAGRDQGRVARTRLVVRSQSHRLLLLRPPLSFPAAARVGGK